MQSRLIDELSEQIKTLEEDIASRPHRLEWKMFDVGKWGVPSLILVFLTSAVFYRIFTTRSSDFWVNNYNASHGVFSPDDKYNKFYNVSQPEMKSTCGQNFPLSSLKDSPYKKNLAYQCAIRFLDLNMDENEKNYDRFYKERVPGDPRLHYYHDMTCQEYTAFQIDSFFCNYWKDPACWTNTLNDTMTLCIRAADVILQDLNAETRYLLYIALVLFMMAVATLSLAIKNLAIYLIDNGCMKDLPVDLQENYQALLARINEELQPEQPLQFIGRKKVASAIEDMKKTIADCFKKQKRYALGSASLSIYKDESAMVNLRGMSLIRKQIAIYAGFFRRAPQKPDGIFIDATNLPVPKFLK